MQSCILILGIFLAGQVSTPGDRYAPVVPSGTPTTDTTTPLGAPPAALQQSASSPTTTTQPEANPLRSNTPPATTAPRATPPRTSQPARIQPARSQPAQPVSPPATNRTIPSKLTKVVKPIDLLRSLMGTGEQRKFSGSAITLGDAVQGASSRAEQSQRVDLYWQLSRTLADFDLANLEEMQLQSQRNGLLQASSDWSTAVQAANARKKLAYSAFLAAQVRLQSAMGRPTDAVLIPTDLPHCGAYQTKFQQIFQGRQSPEAQLLAELLPLRHEQLGQASADTTAAQQWHSLVNQRRNAQGDARLLLKAYEQLALQRRAFVAEAYRYNEDIARYTELAVPQEVGNVRLVAMLIQTTNKSSDWRTGSIQRASAEEAEPRRTAVDRYKPKTAAEEPSSEPDNSAAVPAGSERSILVKPDGTSR